MQCLAPIPVKNDKVGLKSPYAYYRVPCGKCEACVQRKAMEWFVRLKYHERHSLYCFFVTLTYDDAYLPVRVEDGRTYHDVSKCDLQLFNKRLRKALGTDKSKVLKYFCTSEYGPNGTRRPHYHCVYFNLQSADLHFLQECWDKGFVTVRPVTDGRLKYVCSYVTEKLFVPEGCKPVFNLISKGLGVGYVNEYKDWHHGDISRCYYPLNGSKLVLPRYYRERLYTSSERNMRATMLSDEAQERYDEAVEKFGVRQVEEYAHEIRQEFVRQVRAKRKHSKK